MNVNISNRLSHKYITINVHISDNTLKILHDKHIIHVLAKFNHEEINAIQ